MQFASTMYHHKLHAIFNDKNEADHTSRDEVLVFVKNLIGRNQILEAIEILKVSFLGQDKTSSYDAVILVESRWREAIKREISGALTWDELDKCKHAIKAGLLKIVNMEFDS